MYRSSLRPGGFVLAGLLFALTGVAMPTAAAASGPASPTPVASPAPSHRLVAAPDRLTIGVQTASATAPDGRPHYSLQLSPKQVQLEHLAVFNYSTRPVTVGLAALDARTDATGSFSVLAGERPRDAAAWVAFGSRTLRLPARSRAIVTFQIGVPYNALPGDHTAAVVVSLVTQQVTKAARTVQVENQVGMRLYMRVRGPLEPGLQVSGLHASFLGGASLTGRGDVVVRYRITNTGNVRLSAHQRLSLGAWGVSLAHGGAGTGPEDIDEILPGSSVDVSARLHHVPGLLRSSAKVDLLPLRMKGDPGGLLPHQQTRTGFWSIPWLLLMVLLVLGLGWRWSRRRLAAVRRPGRHAASGRHATSARPAPQEVSV